MNRIFRLGLMGALAAPVMALAFVTGPATAATAPAPAPAAPPAAAPAAAPVACSSGTPAPANPFPGTLVTANNFESGSLAPYGIAPGYALNTGGDGTATIDNKLAHSGKCSVHLHVTDTAGSLANLVTPVPANTNNVYADGWFNITTAGVAGNDVPYFRFFFDSTRFVDIYRYNQNGQLWLRVTSSTGFNYTQLVKGSVSMSVWHHVSMHVIANGAASTVEVSLDGTQLFSSNKVATTATTITAVQVGAEHLRQMGDIYIDDLVITASSSATAGRAIRLAGADRITTAIEAAANRTDWGNTVVLTRDDDFADALSSGPLAASLKAPILVNPTTALDPRVAAEIKALATANGGKENVVIVGGTGAVSAGVATALAAIPGVTVRPRLEGADRFQTSVAVSKATITNNGSGAARDYNVFLATGNNFADAMTAGAAAAAVHGVVILTNGIKVTDPSSLAFLNNLGTSFLPGTPAPSVIAVGGSAASAWPTAAKKIVGVDRYDTSAQVANTYFDWSAPGNPKTNSVGIASGEVYADAVIGAGFMGHAGGPLLLTNPTSLNAYTAGYLTKEAGTITSAFVFGGPVRISDAVITQLSTALKF